MEGKILDRVVDTTGMDRSTARRMLTGPRLPDPTGPGVIEADAVARCGPTLIGRVHPDIDDDRHRHRMDREPLDLRGTRPHRGSACGHRAGWTSNNSRPWPVESIWKACNRQSTDWQRRSSTIHHALTIRETRRTVATFSPGDLD